MAAPSPAALSATEMSWHLLFIVGGLGDVWCGGNGPRCVLVLLVLASSSFKLGQCATTTLGAERACTFARLDRPTVDWGSMRFSHQMGSSAPLRPSNQ
jgi:hypothetical protein